MMRFTFLFLFLALGGAVLAETSQTANLDKSSTRSERVLTWDESGYDKTTGPLAGIMVPGAAVVDYRRGGRSAFAVQLGEPVIIATADKAYKWGHFQFPLIDRNVDGTLFVRWNMSEDSITAYGKDSQEIAISRDGGKTWEKPEGTFTSSGAFLLPNGDRIKVATPRPIKVEDLDMPEPVKAFDKSGKERLDLFLHDELPETRQGVFIDRLSSGSKRWMLDRAKLVDPTALRYSLSGLVPIVWWGDMQVGLDGSVFAGIYPGHWLREDGTAEPDGGVLFYRSVDDGNTWVIQGRIAYAPDLEADPKGDERSGFTEPAFEVLEDGTFLCVMRTAGGAAGQGPMYASWSKDQGKTWAKPVVITRSGVLPRLLELENGVIVLSAGRPGVQLRFSKDGGGKTWTDPFEMLPYASEKDQVSCGYTGVLATGPDRFVVIYSDFKVKNSDGENRKAIKIREVLVAPK